MNFKLGLLCLLLVSCAKSPMPTGSISNISIENIIDDHTPRYTIYVNGSEYGETELKKTTAYIINNRSTIQLRDAVKTSSNEMTDVLTYLTFSSGTGYYLYDSKNDHAIDLFLPLPLDIGLSMTGKFGIFTNDLIRVYATHFHSEFISYTGAVFYDVMELRSANDAVIIYINSTHFIIQKEDHRATSVIQTLDVTTPH